MKRIQFIYESSRSGKRPRDVFSLEETETSIKGIDMELIEDEERIALMDAYHELETIVTRVLENNRTCFRHFKQTEITPIET